MTARNKSKKNRIFNIVIVLIFLVGAAVLLYPTVSNLWNEYRNAQLVSQYEQTVSALPDEDRQRLWNDAADYNKVHTQNVIADAFTADEETSKEYNSLLNFTDSGVMGYIEIPAINVKLPVFHGTGKKALEQGCGHVMGTSLPVGGESSHCVLAAHRGLPSAKLFTDADLLKVGDRFTLTVLDEKLAYEIDQILTVLPEELDALGIEEGCDYVTLVTCTPYGVNTHRLLIRGHRVAYTDEAEDVHTAMERLAGSSLAIKLLIITVVIMLMLSLILIAIFRKKHKKEKPAEEKVSDKGNSAGGEEFLDNEEKS